MSSPNARPEIGERIVLALAEFVLALITSALLLSPTPLGAAAALLVPAHILVARRHGVVGKLFWGALALLSIASAVSVLIGGIGGDKVTPVPAR